MPHNIVLHVCFFLALLLHKCRGRTQCDQISNNVKKRSRYKRTLYTVGSARLPILTATPTSVPLTPAASRRRGAGCLPLGLQRALNPGQQPRDSALQCPREGNTPRPGHVVLYLFLSLSISFYILSLAQSLSLEPSLSQSLSLSFSFFSLNL